MNEKEKTQKVSEVLSVRKIYKNMHMRQFFHKRGAWIALHW